jgi:hypothetical protein
MNQVERRTRWCPFAVAPLWPSLENQVKSFEHTTNGKRLLAASGVAGKTLKGAKAINPRVATGLPRSC